MQFLSSVQGCLPPLAAIFSFPNRDNEFSDRTDAIIESGEYAVSFVFKRIREALADGEGRRNPLEMEALAGVTGTGITLLEAMLTMSNSKNVAPLKQKKLRVLLEEYKNLFEDIEMFSSDISAEDCFHAACAGEPFSRMNTHEEDMAWRDL